MECISGSFLLCGSHRRLNKNLFKNVSPRTPSAPTCPVGGREGRTSWLVGWEEGFRWAPGPPHASVCHSHTQPLWSSAKLRCRSLGRGSRRLPISGGDCAHLRGADWEGAASHTCELFTPSVSYSLPHSLVCSFIHSSAHSISVGFPGKQKGFLKGSRHQHLWKGRSQEHLEL